MKNNYKDVKELTRRENVVSDVYDLQNYETTNIDFETYTIALLNNICNRVRQMHEGNITKQDLLDLFNPDSFLAKQNVCDNCTHCFKEWNNNYCRVNKCELDPSGKEIKDTFTETCKKWEGFTDKEEG